MISTSVELHYNTVRPELLDLIKQICADPFFKAYRLVGGTSFSLQIGHRASVDADFFSDGNGQPVPDLLKYIFPKIISKSKVDSQNGCVGMTANGIKLHVFDYGYPFVKQANIVDGIRLASLLDIGLMKLDVQNTRNAWEDIIDLNMITNFHPLSELLSVYNLGYSPLPKKQCFMSLMKNLKTQPSLDNFPYQLMVDNSKPSDIIFGLKKKCVGVYKLIFQQETEIVQSKIKRSEPE